MMTLYHMHDIILVCVLVQIEIDRTTTIEVNCQVVHIIAIMTTHEYGVSYMINGDIGTFIVQCAC